MNFQQKFNILFTNSGLSKNRFAKEMGIAPRTVTNWLNGYTYPNLIRIRRLSEYFGVSLKYLCCDDVEEIIYSNE